MQSMIDNTVEENPPEGMEEHDTANNQKETEVVQCTPDQADPDPPTRSEIVPSGSNAITAEPQNTYPKYPNNQLTDPTVFNIATLPLQSNGDRRW